MPTALIVYASRYGHARSIAERMAEIANKQGHRALLADAATAPDVAGFDVVVLIASIQIGQHPRSMERFARAQREALGRRPHLFISVSLSAQGTAGSPQRREAERCVGDFVRRTGFSPARVELVAGDLPYTRYGPFTRFIMRALVRRKGGPTDTSSDYDFTDWARVARLATDLFPNLGGPRLVHDTV